MQLFLYSEQFNENEYLQLVEVLEENGFIVPLHEKDSVNLFMIIPDYSGGVACNVYSNDTVEFGTADWCDDGLDFQRQLCDDKSQLNCKMMSFTEYLNQYCCQVSLSSWENKDGGFTKSGREWYKNQYGQVIIDGNIIYPDNLDHPCNI